MLFCTMLGLYEFKQLVGENEMVYYHSARNCTFCEYCHFKHIIWKRFNFNKSMAALKGKTNTKAHETAS